MNIKPVKSAEVTPMQVQLLRRFWVKLVNEVRDELKGEGEAKK